MYRGMAPSLRSTSLPTLPVSTSRRSRQLPRPSTPVKVGSGPDEALTTWVGEPSAEAGQPRTGGRLAFQDPDIAVRGPRTGSTQRTGWSPAEHVGDHLPRAACLAPIDHQVRAALVRALPARCGQGETILTDPVGQLPRHVDEGGIEGDVGPARIEQALPERADRLGAPDHGGIRRQQ